MTQIDGTAIRPEEAADWFEAETYTQLGQITDREHDQVFYLGVHQDERQVYVTAKISGPKTVDYLIEEKGVHAAMHEDYTFDDATTYRGAFPRSQDTPVDVEDMIAFYRRIRS